MKSATLTNGTGPGSSISLSPTSIRVRDAIIEKFIDKSLDELNNFLASALDTEKDEAKRIGILAARVYILRMRISKIAEFNQNSMIPAIEQLSPHELANSSKIFDEPSTDNEPADENVYQLEEWNELMTIEDGEVNGVRIPRGVAITVGKDDALRLLNTGKAKQLKEDEQVEESASEQGTLSETLSISDGDGDMAVEAAQSEETQEEQSGEIPADAIEEDPEFLSEDTGMSAAETVADNNEQGVQEASSTEETKATNDVNDEARTDDTNPQT